MDPTTNSNPVDEELVAYLDGELSPEQSEAIERRLAEDPALRNRLQVLEITWDALDALPQSQPTDSFTKSTMELVVSSVTQQLKSQRRQRNRALGILAFLALPIIFGGAAFWLTHSVRNQPYRNLINNLPVIEKFNVYLKLGLDLNLLEQLDQSGIFGDSELTESAARSTLVSADSSDEYLQRESALQAMNSEELKALKYRQEQFERLTLSEKKAVRDFHEALMSHPRCQHLLNVMERFYDWLRTLETSEQSELLSLKSAEQKIEKITSIRKLQSEEVDRLPQTDFEAFDRWIIEIAEKYGSKFKGQIRDSRRIPTAVRDTLLATDETATRAYLRFFNPIELLPKEELGVLQRRLSGSAQRIMGTELREQMQFLRQMLARPQVSDSELQAFYYSDLSPEEREKLDRYSPEVMKAEIRSLYLNRKLLLSNRPR